MKNIVIAGRCTKDAEVRSTQKGEQVAGFSVAVDDGYGANKSTIFFDCSLWGARADKLAPMLTKGKQVTVSGDLGMREHNGKTYLTIRVGDLTLQGGGRSEDSGHQRQDSGYGAAPAGGRDDMDDEIPF
jgi:single-strand DNA-binding protein